MVTEVLATRSSNLYGAKVVNVTRHPVTNGTRLIRKEPANRNAHIAVIFIVSIDSVVDKSSSRHLDAVDATTTIRPPRKGISFMAPESTP